MKNILLIGAAGQIGSELIAELRRIYGSASVVAGDIKQPSSGELCAGGPFEITDITDKSGLADIIRKYKIDTVINMAALLSAKGEQNPHLAWQVNVNGFINILEIARELKLEKVFNPSSIAVFGPSTPKNNTPQETVLMPSTIYGVSKVTCELIGDYYVKKYGMDVRGIRYPGIISYRTMPGGGTTDYAVEIYYEAIRNKKYECFLNSETMLPMMYMPDCIKATVDLLHADFKRLRYHSGYNVASMSFTPEMLAGSIRKFIPGFSISYKPDFRQQIADSWPGSIDDSAAREDWGWNPSFDIDAMTGDMLKEIGEKVKNQV